MRSPCTVLFCKVGEQSVSLSRKLKIATVIIAWFPRARHCCRWIGGTLQWMRKERSLLPWRSHSRGRDRRQMISLSLVSPLPVTLGSLRPFPSGHSSEREWHGWGGGQKGHSENHRETENSWLKKRPLNKDLSKEKAPGLERPEEDGLLPEQHGCSEPWPKETGEVIVKLLLTNYR